MRRSSENSDDAEAPDIVVPVGDSEVGIEVRRIAAREADREILGRAGRGSRAGYGTAPGSRPSAQKKIRDVLEEKDGKLRPERLQGFSGPTAVLIWSDSPFDANFVSLDGGLATLRSARPEDDITLDNIAAIFFRDSATPGDRPRDIHVRLPDGRRDEIPAAVIATLQQALATP